MPTAAFAKPLPIDSATCMPVVPAAYSRTEPSGSVSWMVAGDMVSEDAGALFGAEERATSGASTGSHGKEHRGPGRVRRLDCRRRAVWLTPAVCRASIARHGRPTSAATLQEPPGPRLRGL